MSRRWRKTGVVAVLVATAVAGCADGDIDGPIAVDVAPSVELVVVEQPWTGWSTDQPASETATHLLGEGDTLELAMGRSDSSLRVVSIDDGVVTLRLRGVGLIVGEAQSVDLETCGNHTVELGPGGETRFGTCSDDGGYDWTVRYDG